MDHILGLRVTAQHWDLPPFVVSSLLCSKLSEFSPTFPNSNSNHVDDELILNIYFIYLLLVTFNLDLKNTCSFQHEHGTELPLVETIGKSLSSQQTRVNSTFREDRRPHDSRAVGTHPP